MNKLVSFFQKYATLRSAFLAFILLEIIVRILHRFDAPLLALTHGERKLDLHSSYDLATVLHLFNAYGLQGRTLYAWDLLVDTLYPILLSLSAILFTLVVIRSPFWQKLWVAFPLIFAILDVIENGLFLTFLWRFPTISATAVVLANIITRVKLFAIYITSFELYIFMLIALVMFLLGKLEGGRAMVQSQT